MKGPRLIRGVVLLALLLVGFVLGASASARSELANPLVEHWGGTAWAQVSVPSSSGLTLDTVVAPSATDVWAFGDSPVAVHWNGTAWRRVTLPTPKGLFAQFVGAAALSPDDIWVVGDRAIDHWNGSRWKVVPGLPARAELYGVTALAANDVWAVGQVDSRALALHWNGKAWKKVPTPAPAPSPALTSSSLEGVAASSSRSVWAVGQYSLHTSTIRGSRALTLHWNGSRWKVVPNPYFVAHHVSSLNSVAAPSASAVWAVGSANHKGGAQHALAERWNGKRWSVFRVTGPRLAGVSALASNDAWAAGGPDGSGRVQHWNGKVWTVATKLDRKHGLGAVVEVSPTDIWAVGGRFTY
jgi:hypothetical protein